MKPMSPERMYPIETLTDLFFPNDIVPATLINQLVELEALLTFLISQSAQHELRKHVIQITDELVVRNHLQLEPPE